MIILYSDKNKIKNELERIIYKFPTDIINLIMDYVSGFKYKDIKKKY